jgi:DNA-binding MarR family transcriptional regulator
MATSSAQLCTEFFRVMRGIKAAMSDVAEENGLTLQQAFLMHILYEGGVMQMGEVANCMHCDASNVTGIIDRLLAQEYVIRQESASDRRVKELTLTPKGYKFVHTLLADAPTAVGCDKLKAAEREQLCGMLKRLSVE